ncbi:MAG: hypothetical protein J6Y05_10315 [Bacteroidales bacterium]|nr:hypothetical protein [Bacteroidales bacterium]
MKKYFFYVILAILLASCSSSNRISTLVGGEYDPKKDVTDYFVFPLGEVSLPGKWEKTNFFEPANQQFFMNQDSIPIAIGFTTADKYEFNADKSLKGNDFVKALYDWDSGYWTTGELKSEILETDSTKQYIIYKLYGPKVNTYVLIREKNGSVSNFSIHVTDKWTEREKIQFLKSLVKE